MSAMIITLVLCRFCKLNLQNTGFSDMIHKECFVVRKKTDHNSYEREESILMHTGSVFVSHLHEPLCQVIRPCSLSEQVKKKI